MVYRHGNYSLYTRDVQLQSGRQQTIYFFARNTPKSGTPCSLPRGYAVKVSDRTGMPLLYKDPNAQATQAGPAAHAAHAAHATHAPMGPAANPATDKFAWVRKIFGQ